MQHPQALSLPEPDAMSAAHSAGVAAHIRDKIASAGGCVSFATFMHEALYAPGLGYYSAGATKFGSAGDFVTAPEVSPLFGYVLARQCAPVLAEVREQHEGAKILELGAGSGKLAADLLIRLDTLGALPDEYQILEVSSDLRDRQASFLSSTIPELAKRVTWVDSLPTDFCGVVVANEVLDALPVERFLRGADKVMQQCVAIDGDRFVNSERDAPDTLAAAVSEIEAELGSRFPDGYRSEINLAAPRWLTDVADAVQTGMILLFDYGVGRREYYAADRDAGWLRCHFRHHAHSNPLLLPGIQDITAWVDFTAVAGAAVDAGMDLVGYVSQAHFLMNGGLADELQQFTELAADAQVQLSAQVKRLTLPGEMGENFKCLGLSRNIEHQPAGLVVMDRTMTL